MVSPFDSRGWSPLHDAAARGNLEVLCCLVAHTDNVDIASKQMSNDTPLGLAIEYDKADAIGIVAFVGATIEARNSANNTPLSVAALEGCSGAVQNLMELGAEMSCHNSLKSAPTSPLQKDEQERSYIRNHADDARCWPMPRRY